VIPTGVQVYVALEPVDMRLSFDRLAGLVRERIGYEPRSGALFMFFARRRVTAKILFFDGSGLCQFYKRLDAGRFVVPEAPAPGVTYIEVDEVTFETLLDGIPVEPQSKTRGRRRRLH
jgi:transposase